MRWWGRRPEADAAPADARIPAGSRIYAIGDVHGRLDLFERLIALIRQDSEARPGARVTILVLGDIVDRGGETAALIALCRAATLHSRDFVLLKGNHEEMMTQALRGDLDVMRAWLRHGGDTTLASFGVPDEAIAAGASATLLDEATARIPEGLLDWLDALPTCHRAGDYLFVHAGIRPGVALARQAADDLMWIREDFLDCTDDHGAIVVHGHSIVETAELRHNRIAIDTGAYRTGRLTALALEGFERRLLCATPVAVERPPVADAP